MYTCLSPWALGISLDWESCLTLAAAGGFQGIDCRIERASSPAQIRRGLERHGLRAGGVGLPLDFRGGEEKYRRGLEELPEIGRKAREIGAVRFTTWIPSFSDELPWKEDFRFHVERLGPAARILEEQGCRLGLEFLGPRTVREGHRYGFIRTMEQMLELCEAVGPNAGLLLDSWHWYTSLGTVEEIRSLENRHVVYVHINDAPAGIPVERQRDTVRRLPGATGIIDLAGFLGALGHIGYNGPVTPEPFDPELKDAPPEEAAALAEQAQKDIRSKWHLLKQMADMNWEATQA